MRDVVWQHHVTRYEIEWYVSVCFVHQRIIRPTKQMEKESWGKKTIITKHTRVTYRRDLLKRNPIVKNIIRVGIISSYLHIFWSEWALHTDRISVNVSIIWFNVSIILWYRKRDNSISIFASITVRYLFAIFVSSLL